ncbi:NAD kinase [Fluviicola sp.]|jgi:NAD+ kinase|uniref:NAD kinase n=1 Tax=Fluviicola sp. TaxID=1917219 RepID=UPI002817DB42|nr:NAD kinase [Fluviicola sp.]MDR0803011.1 NAD kinase [Fluviicola sp.]
MRIAVYSKKITKADIPLFKRFEAQAQRFGWKLVLERGLKEQLVKREGLFTGADIFTRHEDFHHGIDLAFSIGGDGTFLKTVSYIRNSEVPILGINTGRLGFLANISDNLFEEALELVRQKRYEHEQRSLLRVETEHNLFGADNVAMNEVTLLKKDTSSMITVNTLLDDRYLNSYWADGLIISTPTGSTAYNLSCGGPIVTPGCQVHIITPIAPHNLNVRPIVVPDNLPIKLNAEGRERYYLLALDGNTKSIRQKEEVLVRKAEYMINVVKLEDTNFLDTIRNKMSWGKDQRN